MNTDYQVNDIVEWEMGNPKKPEHHKGRVIAIIPEGQGIDGWQQTDAYLSVVNPIGPRQCVSYLVAEDSIRGGKSQLHWPRTSLLRTPPIQMPAHSPVYVKPEITRAA